MAPTYDEVQLEDTEAEHKITISTENERNNGVDAVDGDSQVIPKDRGWAWVCLLSELQTTNVY